MSIYLWLSIIIGVVFLLTVILFFRRFISGKDNLLLISTVLILGTVGCVALYIFTSMQGTQILAANFVTEYQIKEETYKTTDPEPEHYLDAAYAFYAENGVKYQLYGTELLKAPDTEPSFIQIYTCEAVEGFPMCYLKKGRVVRYTLTKLSKDGKEPIAY